MSDCARKPSDCRLFGPIVRRPWNVIALVLALCVVAGSGLMRLHVEANARVFLVEGSPEKTALDQLEAAYSKDESVLFVLAPKNGDAFSRSALRAVEEITERVWRFPHVRRVDSLTNFQHATARADEVVIADLVADPTNATAEELARARSVALERLDVVGRLISKDGRVSAVHVTAAIPIDDQDAVKEVAQAARELASTIGARYPDIDLRLTGLVMIDVAMAEASDRDGATLVPLMFGVILVLVALALRSAAATGLTLVIIALSIATGLGLAGWAGLRLNPVSSASPIVILTLAVANCVHVLASYRLNPAHAAMSKADAVASSVQKNYKAILITTATTIAGFLSLNFSDVAPFREFGNVVATGLAANLLLSLTLLPAMMMLVRIRPSEASGRIAAAMDSLGRMVARSRLLISCTALLITVVACIGILRIEFDDNFVHYFNDTYKFRTDTDFTEKHLSGITVFEYSIPASGPEGIADPEYLKKLDEFAEWLRGQTHVNYVFAVTEQIKWINQAMHGDDLRYRNIPDDRETAAQLILLYELSLPFGLDLSDRIRVDKSASRVTVITDNVSSATTKRMAERGKEWLVANAPGYMRAEPTGLSYTFSYVSERNVRSMFVGYLLSIAVTSACLILPFRSLRFGLFSLVPNLFPVLVAFGLWGFFISGVNLAVTVVGVMTFGIIDDDTVHFLSNYLSARRAGQSAEDAIRSVFRSVGSAIIVTSGSLIAGFGALAFSGFAINANMGLLAAITIAIGLVSEFFLTPSLLALADYPRVRMLGRSRPTAIETT